MRIGISKGLIFSGVILGLLICINACGRKTQKETVAARSENNAPVLDPSKEQSLTGADPIEAFPSYQAYIDMHREDIFSGMDNESSIQYLNDTYGPESEVVKK